jgi:cyclophilin family peptidyl-prolyl cis-trans isomerase
MFASTICSLILAITVFTSDDTSEQLLAQFQTCKNSIYNQRGLAPGDKETIQKLRDEMSAWNVNNQDFQLIAAELQLSIWLDDAEKSNALFERLTELQPDNTAIALSWSKFMLAQEGADPNLIYANLIERFPDSPEIVLEWARTLDAQNQFSKAILAMEQLDSSKLSSTVAAELYASLLYANNRFEDSLAALNAVDPTIIADDPRISTRFNSQKTKSSDAIEKWNTELSIREVEEVAADLPLAIMHTSKGPIELELFEDHAPNTVANFISLADSGYYDGILFHRVIPKFMAQGGDPNSRDNVDGNAGEGGPGYNIKDEHTSDDHRNHFAGSLSMAKTAAPNTGGSQFFLTHLPTPHLDGRHTVFGRITSGLDTARAIEKDDEIITILIVRKREHKYEPEKVDEKTVTIGSKDKPKLMKSPKSE